MTERKRFEMVLYIYSIIHWLERNNLMCSGKILKICSYAHIIANKKIATQTFTLNLDEVIPLAARCIQALPCYIIAFSFKSNIYLGVMNEKLLTTFFHQVYDVHFGEIVFRYVLTYHRILFFPFSKKSSVQQNLSYVHTFFINATARTLLNALFLLGVSAVETNQIGCIPTSV